jgi:periplasmic protein TonB
MSAIPQFRARESEDHPPTDPESLAGVSTPERGNPIQLLRAAIDGLNSSEGYLPDQGQVANLLAEAQEALERAQQLAAAIRAALEEAQWFVDQNRPDLAAQFLKEKLAELPGQGALAARLQQLESLLPHWEQERHEQAALAQAAALEEQQQWQAALSILEGALQPYPHSAVLSTAAKRVQDLLSRHEREKKLARRLELIRQKITEQSWKQAATLLDTTQKAFPEAAGLAVLRREVDAGRRNADCEAIITEVRQHLADGDTERAQQVLRAGLQSLGPEAQFEALAAELEAERKYREDLRMAQMLFGRHQFQEAERLLSQLVTQERAEARALLEAVRHARAAAEEENFCERGREKALKLMEHQQYAAAADLLRNLVSLFPGNAILQRDLAAAQSACERANAAAVDAGRAQPQPEPAPAKPPEATASPVAGKSSRFRRAAVAGAASLAIASASGAVWTLSRSHTPPARPVVPPVIAQPPVQAPAPVAASSIPPPPPEAPAAPKSPAVQPPTAVKTPATKEEPKTRPAISSRPFIPPNTKQPREQASNVPLPLPPGVSITSSQTPVVPADIVRPAIPAAPPPAVPAPSVPAPAPAPALRIGGQVKDAQLMEQTKPDYPPLARTQRLSGTVRLEASIDARGAVTKVKVLSGDPVLAAAAQTAVSKWKYKPATLNGQPIATTAEIQVRFDNQKN